MTDRKGGDDFFTRRDLPAYLGLMTIAGAGLNATSGGGADAASPPMDAELLRQLRALLDKQAIAESFLRYTRGIDRMDVELIKSAFHSDAIDNHTRAVRGSIDEMLAWWLPQQPDREATQHFVTNQSIDLDGDSAHVETYFIAIVKLKGVRDATIAGGRYVDRFEKRNGDWRVALRVVLPEWAADVDAQMTSDLDKVAMALQRRDRSDLSYQRPLRNPPPGKP